MAWAIPRLTVKNLLFVVAGVCVIALTIIPLIHPVPAWISIVIGAAAVFALVGQALV